MRSILIGCILFRPVSACPALRPDNNFIFQILLLIGATWSDGLRDVCKSSYEDGIRYTQLSSAAPGKTWAVQKCFHLSTIIFTTVINVFTLVCSQTIAHNMRLGDREKLC